MIPKNIYYVWVGGKDKPAIFYECLESWQKNLPGYNIIEINEYTFDLDYHLEHNKFFNICYERKMWAFVSDYMRVIHLYENGGIYLDTDMQIIKDISTLIDNKVEFFAGFEDDNLINGAILGASKGSEILKNIIEFYNKDIWGSPLFSIPSIITYTLNNYIPNLNKIKHSYYDEKVKIYPYYYFYPYHYTEDFTESCITDQTYAIHWWSHSWNKIDDYIFLRTKHLVGVKQNILAFLIKNKHRIKILRQHYKQKKSY